MVGADRPRFGHTDVPPNGLTRPIARLHRRAARSLGVDMSRPKDAEEFAQRDLAASETLGAKLACEADGEVARDDLHEAGERDAAAKALVLAART